jgi:hypothetical protein
MNWKLIFTLSLFGLAMSVATVFWIPEKVEGLFWLVIFIINGYFLAKNLSGKYFINGFMISIVNCVYIVAAHVIFYHQYLENHPSMREMNHNMHMQYFSDHPRQAMIIMGPLFGIVFGLVQGLIAWIASKIVKNNTAAAV